MPSTVTHTTATTLDPQSNSPSPPDSPLPARIVWFMAISVGAIVANIYYAQPLLAQIARQFHLSVTQAGLLAMASQVGTASGMLFFVPLGDTRERRSLISSLLLASAVVLLLVATSRSALWFALSSFALGATSCTVHIFLPLAAHLAPIRQRGRVLGSILSGLLFGILLARTVSGFLGAHFGWRAVFFLAAALMLLLSLAVRLFLPRSEPEISLSYGGLLKSIIHLVLEHASLRESALLGALLFMTFSAFWTILVFLLQTPPYHYGSGVAGLFGLVGAVGALGAPFVGRLADRHGPRTTLGVALLTVFLSFLWLGFFGKSLPGLIFGVIFLDLGIQSGHVSNQTRIYHIAPDAKSRLNTFYMVSYFAGGSLGSLLGAWSWRLAQWQGVCLFGSVSILIALFVYWRGNRARQAGVNPGWS